MSEGNTFQPVGNSLDTKESKDKFMSFWLSSEFN